MAMQLKDDHPSLTGFEAGNSRLPVDETLDTHTCDWSEWRKPTGDLIGSCHEYRVCLVCGAVDAAGEPEPPEDDDEARCEHLDCIHDFENGYVICNDCDDIVRWLTDEGKKVRISKTRKRIAAAGWRRGRISNADFHRH